jgi:hypothetical protein
MAKYIMVVGSGPTEGNEAEYNKWYDEVHLGEVCAIPGVTGAKRFQSDPGVPGATPYLAIYELDVEDPTALVAELGRRSSTGVMHMSPTIDVANVQMGIYKVR